MNIKEKIAELEEELRTTKYNKRTQHHIGLVKAKIARLKRDLAAKSCKKTKHIGFSVKKTGDATVVLVGYPSVGKSTLLNKLTNAKSAVGDYDFTTLNIIPGMMHYNGAKIQILDIPGIVEGASRGQGRGREVLSVAKIADLVVIIVDNNTWQKLSAIKEELYKSDFRLNKKKPDVTIQRLGYGGIDFGATVKLTKIKEATVKSILREFGYTNSSIVICQDISYGELIDVIEANKVYVPCISVVNKLDLISDSMREWIEQSIKPELFISSVDGTNLDELRALIFSKLELIRVFLKIPGKKPDMESPLILKSGSKIRQLCISIHKELLEDFRFARVWGSTKFPGQPVGLEFELKDKDIVQIVTK